MFSGLNTGNMLLIVLVLVLILAGVYVLIIYSRFNKASSSSMKVSKIKIGGNEVKSVTGDRYPLYPKKTRRSIKRKN